MFIAVRISYCCGLFLLGISHSLAFHPPLTQVETATATNGFATTVQFRVFDPELNLWASGQHPYSGNSAVHWNISKLRVDDGIVTWLAIATGQFEPKDQEVGFAVYDPARKVWSKQIELYPGNALNHWAVNSAAVSDGLVAWTAIGDGLLPTWDQEVALATYNPGIGLWQVHQHRYAGVDWSYWMLTNLTVASGLAAWQVVNTGDAALGHAEAAYVVFDPIRGTWIESKTRYQGKLNNPWIISGLSISNHAVQWTAANQTSSASEMRGYDHSSGLWLPGVATTPLALFSASTDRGAAPFTVWFTDLSLGGDTQSWDFGDGSGSAERSPYHTFAIPGVFTATQTVEGPGGAHASSLAVREDTPPGFLKIDITRLERSNDMVTFNLIGESVTRPVIIKASTNLTHWDPLYTNVPPAGRIQFLDPSITQGVPRFYRAVIAP